MKAIRIFAAVLAAGGLTVVGMSSADAATPSYTCRNSTLGTGTYANVAVAGSCYVDGNVRVTGKITQHTKSSLEVGEDSTLRAGNLVLQTGASFLNDGGATTHVLGNVTVGANAQLGADTTDSIFKVDGDVTGSLGSSVALGCTEAHPCSDSAGPPPDTASQQSTPPFVQTPALDNVSVGGSVYLQAVFNAAINGATIGGSLISSGGGAGPLNPEEEFIPFSIKDDTVGGDIQVNGLSTVWFGVIRTRVGGSVTLTGNQGSDPDSNEVVANKITGNLVCTGNNPPAQYGDAIFDAPFPGYGQNFVGGQALGECAPLIIPVPA